MFAVANRAVSFMIQSSKTCFIKNAIRRGIKQFHVKTIDISEKPCEVILTCVQLRGNLQLRLCVVVVTHPLPLPIFLFPNGTAAPSSGWWQLTVVMATGRWDGMGCAEQLGSIPAALVAQWPCAGGSALSCWAFVVRCILSHLQWFSVICWISGLYTFSP